MTRDFEVAMNETSESRTALISFCWDLRSCSDSLSDSLRRSTSAWSSAIVFVSSTIGGSPESDTVSDENRMSSSRPWVGAWVEVWVGAWVGAGAGAGVLGLRDLRLRRLREEVGVA